MIERIGKELRYPEGSQPVVAFGRLALYCFTSVSVVWAICILNKATAEGLKRVGMT